jgi:hypothetical protein
VTGVRYIAGGYDRPTHQVYSVRGGHRAFRCGVIVGSWRVCFRVDPPWDPCHALDLGGWHARCH